MLAFGSEFAFVFPFQSRSRRRGGESDKGECHAREERHLLMLISEFLS
jgi:hypothetical protein